MTYQEFESFFSQSCSQNNLEPPSRDQIVTFYRFTEHLITVNQTTNLTAIRDIPSIITKHYVDSLLASQYISKEAAVLDIGCGPGFPSIPLAITRPDLHIIALDSTQKKITFVRESSKICNLSNLKAVSARAEDEKTLQSLGKFDFVVSRAVARLNVLCELALPYTKKGGYMLALKGSQGDEELFEADHAIKALGGTEKHVFCHQLITANESEDRMLILIKKERETPSVYPRPFAAIKKKPL